MVGWGKHTQEVQDDVTGVVVLDDGGMEEVGWDGGMDEDGGVTTLCAWCLAEQGRVPDPADSHGICAAHSALVWQAYCERKTRSSQV